MANYDMLNIEQREAVFSTEGPLLILAGAGSGKTRVLTYRAAYLMEEQGVSPWHILAITFTNKAAGEMRDRIEERIGPGAESIWVATFHSTCVRILRRFIDRIGFETNFSIYDADDQKHVMKDVCKRLGIDTKMYPERSLLRAVSAAKDELISPEEYTKDAVDLGEQKKAQVYREYQQELRKNNALDFDDLIMKCVELLSREEEVRNYYQDRFRYVMVDEYQDTNTAQFELVRLLSGKYRNLCVVGDDDQSIYKFRGANIRNILNFETYFPDAKVIRLEQNYRSTGNILDAANAVIRNNRGRKEKTLWTQRGPGDRIIFCETDTAQEEAYLVAKSIRSRVESGECAYSSCAVLYRTNAQSRLLEERFLYANIPYKLVGGVNFYSRREIKDLLAYLKMIANGRDDLAVLRIINVPKRGIGATTVNRVQEYALQKGCSFYDALKNIDEIESIKRAASAKVRPFVNLIQLLRTKREFLSVQELLEELIEATGYARTLEAEHTEEARERLENIDELISKVAAYEESTENPTLDGFLQEVSLVADIDSVGDERDCVLLMTLHSAKGLEFPNVYLTGMEEGLFPGYMAITSGDPNDLEEERRLCYVGITRAMDHLTMTAAGSRMVRGETRYNEVSRFVQEIPPELFTGSTGRRREGGRRYGSSFGSCYEEDSYEDSRAYGSSYGSFASGAGVQGSPAGGRSAYGLSGRSTSAAQGTSDPAYGTASAGWSAYGLSGKSTSAGQSLNGVSAGGGAQPQTGRTGASSGSHKLTSLDYEVGDRVLHGKFKEGTVTKIVSGGRDFEVTVDFDKFGTKKMFASFAKLKKL